MNQCPHIINLYGNLKMPSASQLQWAPTNRAMPPLPTTIQPIGPTGAPTGPQLNAPTPLQQPLPVPIDTSFVPQTVANIAYTQGYLKTQIGKKVKVDFLIGTNMMQDRSGTLLEVGTSYIILRETETDDLLLCDLYSIKFVKFYY